MSQEGHRQDRAQSQASRAHGFPKLPPLEGALASGSSHVLSLSLEPSAPASHQQPPSSPKLQLNVPRKLSPGRVKHHPELLSLTHMGS